MHCGEWLCKIVAYQEGLKDLVNVALCLYFGDALVALDVVKELAAIDQLLEQNDSVLCLHDVKQLDQVNLLSEWGGR